MELATLIVAALGALFTAATAIAALLAAWTARDEARERSQPYMAAELPQLSVSGDEVLLDVKNLGLGPARRLAILFQVNGMQVATFLSAGLAPMEAQQLVLPLMLWDRVEPPALDQVWVSGGCEDAAGRFHPLFLDGAARPVDHDTVARAAAFSRRPEIVLRHELKQVVRAARSDSASPSMAAWMRFWLAVEAAGWSPAEMDEHVRAFWLRFGGAPDRYRSRSDLLLTDADRQRHEEDRSTAN